MDHSVTLANKKCHEKLDFYLHRPIVEYLIIFLIVVDALIVTASLLLEIKIIEATPQSHGTGDTTPSHTQLDRFEIAAEALHFTSFAILSLFLIEVFLKLYAQREKFFKRKLQVVDSFIVAISFALDLAVVIVNITDSTIIQGLGLIIILRLWRLVRIVNGAVVATKEKLTESVHEARREAGEAKELVEQLQTQLAEKDREIEFLKSRLVKYEPIDMIPTGSTRLPAYLPETKEFPRHVLGDDVTDDEDYRFTDISQVAAPRIKPQPPVTYTAGTAFQAYQPGATYQPTSQYPTDNLRSHSGNQLSGGAYRPPPFNANTAGQNSNYPDTDPGETADESDIVSIKPAKSRSGNTFTVKKDGVPMTSL